MKVQFYIAIFLLALASSTLIYKGFMPEYVIYGFEEYCQHFGYPVEAHTTMTDDGYILTMFRIQKKGTKITDGLPVVFFQHGVLDCSDTFIINDEDKAPAFIFANQGYDVWLGNNRGNTHSRKHIKYNPDKDKEFWNFTFTEMGEYDIPAMFQYVLLVSGQQKLDYIAHSEGTMVMFIALSERIPIVVNSIKKFVSLGPVAYCYQSYKGKFDNLYKLAPILDPLANFLHPKDEIMPSTWIIRHIGSRVCHYAAWICTSVIGTITNYKPKYDNSAIYDAVAGRDPAGTSKKNIDHFFQLIHYEKFQKFDYGTEGNIEHYGQPNPPVWDLSNISERMAFVSGRDDKMADPKDIARLIKELTSAQELIQIQIDGGHLTYMWGKNMTFINDVLAFLKEQ